MTDSNKKSAKVVRVGAPVKETLKKLKRERDHASMDAVVREIMFEAGINPYEYANDEDDEDESTGWDLDEISSSSE
jgi:hypothetical protein